VHCDEVPRWWFDACRALLSWYRRSGLVARHVSFASKSKELPMRGARRWRGCLARCFVQCGNVPLSAARSRLKLLRREDAGSLREARGDVARLMLAVAAPYKA
jgi:hypothetical protein